MFEKKWFILKIISPIIPKVISGYPLIIILVKLAKYKRKKKMYPKTLGSFEIPLYDYTSNR